jgi:hypothetical protein
MIAANQQQMKLTGIWVFWFSMLMMWLGITLFFDFTGDQYRLATPESPPVFLRSMLYVVTIATFPLSNLLRHILIRLNETIPGAGSAKSRYSKTILISMLIANSIGCYGVLLYLRGDTINTLYIFSSLSALALWLYRPKPQEYQQVIEALNNNIDE